MSLPQGFRRVGPRARCPICDRPDWCLVSAEDLASPARAVCARVESGQRFGDAGWLHRLRDERPRRWRAPRVLRLDPAGSNRARIDAICRQGIEGLDEECLASLSRSLVLSSASLRALQIGWCGWAWTFPMRDAQGQAIGIRVRKADGAKLCIRGSRQGLFIPQPLVESDQLAIAEGPTDTAALLDLGVPAVGRPSCTGGTKLLLRFARRLERRRIVVFADSDAPGQAGAHRLARALRPYCRDLRVVLPPSGLKDVRQWKQRGATSRDICRAIEAAQPLPFGAPLVVRRVRR